MGGGDYSEAAHEALTTSRASLPREEVFRETQLHKDMNPYGVKVRESRDSANHPNSIAIEFWTDVTGSMGHIPHDLATRTMPKFMKVVLDVGIEDPQVFFGAIGDATDGDESPLQAGQFESEAELMDKWLTSIHLEGHGGGHGSESYQLGYYFSARHTALDCWEKRGRKGYSFMTGDELPYETVSRAEVKRLVGVDIKKDIPTEAIIAEAGKTHHNFFLVPDQQRAARIESAWRRYLGANLIVMETYEDTCEVAASLIGLTEGVLTDLNAVTARLKDIGTSKSEVNRVIRAITPYAATLGRGIGTQAPSREGSPKGGGSRGAKRT